MLTRVSLFIFLFSLSFATIIAQDIHSLALPNIAIDGSPDEWPQPFRYYDGNTKLQFAIANDTSYIYICLKITDEQAQNRLFRAGLNVWVDPKGKKKESVGLGFPTKPEHVPGEMGERQNRRSNMDGPRKPDLSKLKQHVFMEQITLRAKGFNGVPDQVLQLNNNYGIKAAFNWDTLDILCIEYQLPVKLTLGHNLTAADTVKPIGLGFVVNGIDTPKGEGEGEEMDGGGMGGRGIGGINNNGRVDGMSNGAGGMNGGMRGSGMHGGGGGMSGSSANQLSQEQKVWSKLVLNYK